MPEVAIKIGDKKFTVTCQPGEESALEAAASLLNDEASFLVSEIGQLSEQKLLLMSGLMLADKMTSQSEKLAKAERALEEALAKAKTNKDGDMWRLKGGGMRKSPAYIQRVEEAEAKVDALKKQLGK